MTIATLSKPVQSHFPDSFSTYSFIGSELDADSGGQTSNTNYQLSKHTLRQTLSTLREYYSTQFQK